MHCLGDSNIEVSQNSQVEIDVQKDYNGCLKYHIENDVANHRSLKFAIFSPEQRSLALFDIAEMLAWKVYETANKWTELIIHHHIGTHTAKHRHDIIGGC